MVTIQLTDKEAKLLKEYVQNPFSSAPDYIEPFEESQLRATIWAQLQGVL